MEAFHMVLTTHNSRISARMMKYKIISENPVELNAAEEILLTKIIADIVKEKGYRILAFNICVDHVHLIIVCEFEELTAVLKTIKGKSAYLFNKRMREVNGLKPIGESKGDFSKGFQPIADTTSIFNPDEHNGHLWSQKYFRANLDVWTLAELSPKAGYLYNDSYLDNAVVYIQNNRQKHQLPECDQLTKIIAEMTISGDEAFAFHTKEI
ncbi:MAG: transposase [Saprospiraceae bacterium]|nr:transposase [Saprospiraceae bacterium]